MINPRSLVASLHKHWDLVENLVLRHKSQPVFDVEQVLAVLARCYVDEDNEQHYERLQALLSSEILQTVPRSDQVQLNEDVRQFVSNLLHEHELGLSQVLKVRIDDIKSGLSQLHQAMEQNDMAALHRGSMRVDSQLRQILQQLAHDQHAIMDIAERAKANDARIPIAQRYKEVLHAYDLYVLPMTELMDTGAGGSFYPLLEEAERLLDSLSETLEIQGGLYRDRLILRQVAFRVKDLRRVGREVLLQCTQTLMPLREEVRQHNKLSAAIGTLLGQVRKKGLKRTFAKDVLPQWRREQQRKIIIDDSLLDLMAQARDYQPQAVSFPDELEQNSLAMDWIDEEEVVANLQHALPVNDLMSWLALEYGALPDIALLRLYHHIVQRDDMTAELAEQEQAISLQQVTIRLFSHHIARNQ